MKRERVLWILIILLIAVNAVALFFISSGRPPKPDNKFDRIVTDKLKLDESQLKQFDVMKREHHQQIVRLDREMRSTYERYFYLLTDTINVSEKDSLESVLTDRERQKIRITYDHFNELKSICSEEQQEKFKELVPLLMEVINPGKKPGVPRRN